MPASSFAQRAEPLARVRWSFQWLFPCQRGVSRLKESQSTRAFTGDHEGFVSRDHHHIHSAQPWQSSLPYSLIFAGTRRSKSESGLMSQWRPWIGLTASRAWFSISLPPSINRPFLFVWPSAVLVFVFSFKLSARLKFQTLRKRRHSDYSEIETFRSKKSRLWGKSLKWRIFYFIRKIDKCILQH